MTLSLNLITLLESLKELRETFISIYWFIIKEQMNSWMERYRGSGLEAGRAPRIRHSEPMELGCKTMDVFTIPKAHQTLLFKSFYGPQSSAPSSFQRLVGMAEISSSITIWSLW